MKQNVDISATKYHEIRVFYNDWGTIQSESLTGTYISTSGSWGLGKLFSFTIFSYLPSIKRYNCIEFS